MNEKKSKQKKKQRLFSVDFPPLYSRKLKKKNVTRPREKINVRVVGRKNARGICTVSQSLSTALSGIAENCVFLGTGQRPISHSRRVPITAPVFFALPEHDRNAEANECLGMRVRAQGTCLVSSSVSDSYTEHCSVPQHGFSINTDFSKSVSS